MANGIRQLEENQEGADKDVSESSEESDSDDDISSNEESESENDVEEVVDVYNTGKTAKKISWGAPSRVGSEQSHSSAGVNVYGRGAEKSMSKEKKKKKSVKKNHLKESSKKSKVDIIEKDAFSAAVNSTQGGSGQGRGRGKGRGKGQTRGRGRGRGGKVSRGT